jgi:hypothetical protein
MTEITIFGYAAGGSSCCEPSSGCCAPSPVDVANRVAGMVSRQYGHQEQNLPLPVLAIAGKPLLSGDFHLYDVAKVLKEVAAGEQAD